MGLLRVLVLLSLWLEASGLSLPKHSPVVASTSSADVNACDRRAFATRIFTGTTALTTASLFAPKQVFAAAVSIDGDYWDPYHPSGLRSVKVDGSTVTVVGRDEFDGAEFVLKGSYKEDEVVISGQSGAYKSSPDSKALVFSDGKKWIKVPPMAGLYKDPNHPEGYRVVTVFPVGFGSDFLMAKVYGSDGPGKGSFKLTGKLDSPFIFPEGNRDRTQVSLDFSPKGGPSSLIATFDGTGLVFPDGNKWAKIDQ